MLSFLTMNLMLSALVASQPHGNPENKTQLSLTSPRSNGPVPSCGLLIDDDRVGNIMLRNGQCNSIARKAASVNLNTGCVCVLFGKAGCEKEKLDSWRSVSAGPYTDYELDWVDDIKWYQCTADQTEAQNWVDRFADYVSKPRPNIVVEDGRLVWQT